MNHQTAKQLARHGQGTPHRDGATASSSWNQQTRARARHGIRSRQHEIFVLSIEQMDAIVQDFSGAAAPKVKAAWAILRSKLEFGAGYYSTADDIVTCTRLIADLGISTRAYIRVYGGQAHIILKGLPGLRKRLTAPRYGVLNPKVLAMGLGRAGATEAAKKGGILTVYLLTAYRVLDYLLTDQATLGELVGALASDVCKVAISVGASRLAVMILTTAVPSMIAVGPLAIVIVAGVGSGILLGLIDEHFRLSERLIQACEQLELGLGEKSEGFQVDAIA